MKRPIVAFIGARGGSKGIPDKNIIDLCGFPLIAYPIVASRMSKYISHTFVSTDSNKIRKYALEYLESENNIIQRPDALAQDDSLDIHWIRHALIHLHFNKVYPKLIIHLRTTTPLIDPEVIDRAIAIMLQDKESTALRSAHALSESPHKMFIKEDKQFKPFMTEVNYDTINNPRQSFPTAYVPNGYVDILLPEIVIPKTYTPSNLHGTKIRAFVTNRVIELDEHEDLELLRYYAQNSRIFKQLSNYYAK